MPRVGETFTRPGFDFHYPWSVDVMFCDQIATDGVKKDTGLYERKGYGEQLSLGLDYRGSDFAA